MRACFVAFASRVEAVVVHISFESTALSTQSDGSLTPPRDEVEYDITLYESICLAWIDATTFAEGEKVVRECIRCRPISWHTCWLTLQQLKEDTIPEQMPEEFLSVNDFCNLMDQLSQIHAWDFLTVREDCGPGH